ncbi:hypothetical protein M406DRAFT_322690 [Cryphonectria parasitica EP155]|uniref:Uncharacterized protein n=1 Tax=Cryphonectria parasitica (strain ATCC 38755 / EP155) TaxID=660469 RepID=A0A9P4Y1B7_CRYP1|nr:uncharacterized protein M406DRAFT_322690 [Cryphonectria parasitica EP155]KAF3764699.1 hypothetical protein M406DRAFT_322690 [Cryphonectria parasitica EP155]
MLLLLPPLLVCWVQMSWCALLQRKKEKKEEARNPECHAALDTARVSGVVSKL